MVCLYVLPDWAQARTQLAAVSSGRWESAALHISPTTTQGWRDFSVASHKSPECPQLSVNALHTGSVSSVIFGKVGKSRVSVFLQSELPVQVRPLFTALVFHTLLLETMVETGVCQTQSGLSLFQMKNTRQIPNQVGRGVSTGHVLGKPGWCGPLLRPESSADGLYWEELLNFTPIVT